ncbi:MAG: biotin--[acetyl-CoA-carboxylase] ligase [Sphingobacteriales bacterium]|nr:biotin--[acetyl-CoA-carboxylase] ligase [Sphingobacteriales bacterium]
MQNNTFSGLFIGKNVLKLNKVNSTNTYLKDALSKSAPLKEGTVIMAEEQFAGRGQTNNTWVSEPGKNLTFSLLLTPHFLAINKQFDLNKTICLAINDVLTKYIGDMAKIKWPNDVYAGGHKMGGILIENVIQGDQIKYAIIGVGLNVNQTEFPISIKNVTSLKQILHTDYDLQMLLSEICQSIEVRYLQLQSIEASKLTSEYLSQLYLINQRGDFLINGIKESGRIHGVTLEGYLEIELSSGIKKFGLKEIEFIPVD